MTGIETKVEGSTASVDGLSNWLRESLKARVNDASEDVVAAKRLAERQWQGESGAAYIDFNKDIVKVADEHTRRVERAAGKVDRYSGRLQRMKTRMGGVREDARNGGLTVTGTLIEKPAAAVAPGEPTGELTPEQAAQHLADKKAYQDQLAKVRLYDRLLGEVEQENENFVDWVDTNLTPATKALDAPMVEKLVAYLKDNAGNLGISYALTHSERALDKKVAGLLKEAKEMRRWRRSGNPAKRAKGNTPETRSKIRDLKAKATWFGKGGKLLGPLGTVIEVFGALESPSPAGGLIAAGVGIGVTALVIATAPVSVPTAVVVAGAVALGAGATWAVNKGWDALPDGFTEPVDDWVGDRWEDTKDTVSDGWNEVKSWF